MTVALFEAALAAARDVTQVIPALSEFAPFPLDAHLTSRPPLRCSAIGHLQADRGSTSETTDRLAEALVALAPHVEWRHSYTAEQAGADFLNRYGWFELVGPEGHYESHSGRVFGAYWGPHLYYPWHWHQAEEAYLIVSGAAIFEAEGRDPSVLEAGHITIHQSNQPHAMRTDDAPVLALVCWRGAGLHGQPQMGS